jgi:hypothetical protein
MAEPHPTRAQTRKSAKYPAQYEKKQRRFRETLACRSKPGLSGDEIATHGFSHDMSLRSVLDTIVCAGIAGMEMQEDA